MKTYAKIFSLQEFQDSKLLQAIYYAVSFSFFVTFYGWIGRDIGTSSSVENASHICPPYFLECYKYFFYNGLPFSYTQNFFYVALYLILLWGVLSALKGNWISAHISLFITFIWKVIWIFLFSYGLVGNFDYYDMILAFVLLFLPYKVYFASLSFVWMYFLASTIKIHEGWIFGNYFRSLITGAPFFGDNIIAFFTNIVILMQMLGAWFLLSKNKILQKLSFLYFLIFHIYSGFLVEYRYISISIPALYILFGKDNFFGKDAIKNFEILKVSKKTIAGYLFLIFLLAGQLTGIVIAGDQKKTLEGNYYGMFMFEANHQCISNATIYNQKGEVITTINRQNAVANNRCDPYRYFYQLNYLCKINPEIKNITWTFDHSINGHKFERLVNTENACLLNYKSFAHNDWIKLDGEAEVLDLPVYKNGYGNSDNVIKYQIPTNSYENKSLLNFMTKFYFALWFSILFFVVGFLLFKSYKK